MILMIGYGNPLCGDDGIGPYAVEQLTLGNEESHLEIEYLTPRQLTPELAEPISRAQAVIFVDASADEAAGEINCRELIQSAELPQMTPGAFTHHVNAAMLLENAGTLFGACPKAYLYTIGGENFKLGDSFSRAVESSMSSLLEQLKARVSQCMNLA